MHRQEAIGLGLSALASLMVSTPVFAGPSVEVVREDAMLSPRVRLQASYPRLRGLEPQAQGRLDDALRALARAPGQAALAILAEARDDGYASVHTEVTYGVLTARLGSFTTFHSTDWGGAYPTNGQAAANFDLRTGERIADTELFAPGALAQVHARVVEALRSSYTVEGGYLLRDPAPGDLGQVLVTDQGLAFLWSEGELDSPHVVGPPAAFVTFGCLGGLLNEELLGELAADADQVCEGLPLPGAEPEGSPFTQGRVLTQGGALLARAVQPGGWGPVIARLSHQQTVEVVQVAPPGELFHTVALPGGERAHVHKYYVLLEAPRFGLEGRVYRAGDGELRFGTSDGLPLIAKPGPGHPDAELDAVSRLLDEDGMTPPLVLDLLEREIGSRRWFAPLRVEVMVDDHPFGEGAPEGYDPAGLGAEDALKQAGPR